MSGGKASRRHPVLWAVLFLTALQLIRIATVWAAQSAFPGISRNGVNGACFVLLLAVVLAYAKRRRVFLPLFPQFPAPAEKAAYGVFSGIAVLLLIFSVPLGAHTPESLFLPLYSVLILPAFEETLFRGLVWAELQPRFASEKKVLLAVALLFALWHLGFADSILYAMRIHGRMENLFAVLFWKVVTGFCFGIVTGIARYKWKNCFAGFLIHGVLNLFAR